MDGGKHCVDWCFAIWMFRCWMFDAITYGHTLTQPHTHTHHTAVRSIWFSEIEWRQTGPFCCIAPRASTLSEELPNKLCCTHTHTHSLASLAALLLFQREMKGRIHLCFCDEQRLSLIWKWEYLRTVWLQAYSAIFGLVFVHYMLSVVALSVSRLIMKISSQIDFLFPPVIFWIKKCL